MVLESQKDLAKLWQRDVELLNGWTRLEKLSWLESGKTGGGSFYCMSAAAGMKMYGKCHYLQIEKPHRIVYTQEFCDENEKIARHPMSPTWPASMLTTIELTAEDDRQTRVTVTWECHGATTTEELATFIQSRGGMTQGWTGSFDKLEDYISTIQSV